MAKTQQWDFYEANIFLKSTPVMRNFVLGRILLFQLVCCTIRWKGEKTVEENQLDQSCEKRYSKI